MYFTNLKRFLDLIVVGCAAHIILNNAVQTAADTLPIDVQVIIGNIFQ